MVLSDRQKSYLQAGGFLLFLISNYMIAFSTGDTQTIQIDNGMRGMLSQACEAYLKSHTPYDVPPYNCDRELQYLIRRAKAALEDMDSDRNNTDLSVPEDGSADPDTEQY